MAKFLEADLEKVERLMELYVEYAQRVAAFEARSQLPHNGSADSDAEAEEDAADAELDALAAGGYTLQRLAAVMVAAAARSTAVAARCEAKLRQHGHSLAGVRAVLQSYISGLGQDAAAAALRSKLEALMPVEEDNAAAAGTAAGAASAAASAGTSASASSSSSKASSRKSADR
jgi:hypothetical protein